MKIISHKFLSADDVCDLTVKNWSRAYEYPLVLSRIKEILTGTNEVYPMIHNTACGGMYPVHRCFIHELINIDLGFEVVNSDLWPIEQISGWGLNPYQINYRKYDINTRWRDLKFDVVLCISTLEHLKPENVKSSFHNLYDQLNPCGRLIITYEYADVDPEIMKNLIGCWPDSATNPLTKKTSKVRSGSGGVNDTMIAYLEVGKEDWYV